MQASACPDVRPDLLLVGGGLANGLLALRLAQVRPDLVVHIVEQETALGGNHTWSFFESDLTPAQAVWIDPLVAHRWPGYSVRFPAFERRLPTGYRSVTSDRFDTVLTQSIPGRRIVGKAAVVSPTSVILEDGRKLDAKVVIDGRGPIETPDLALGFQKFVGLELRIAGGHGLTEPIVMDAQVDQDGGYRFVYTLPLGDRTVLIEDTRYTDGPVLDRERFRTGVLDYAQAQGWDVEKILREEHGVLPVALDGDLAAHFRRRGPTAQIGLRAALFHPTTGYSLPDAVRLAEHLADNIDDTDVAARIRSYATRVWKERGFYRLLNRMLFGAAAPASRYKILERFYRLPTPLIERFYAARPSRLDKLRILSGRPPVPVSAALPCLLERGHA